MLVNDQLYMLGVGQIAIKLKKVSNVTKCMHKLYLLKQPHKYLFAADRKQQFVPE